MRPLPILVCRGSFIAARSAAAAARKISSDGGFVRDFAMTKNDLSAAESKSLIRKALQQTRLLAGYPDVIETFSRVAQIRTYANGETIAKEGDPSHSLLVIAEGSIQTSRTNANGKRLVFDFSQPGQVTGFYSLMDAGGFPIDNTARGLTRIVAVPGDVFLEALHNTPGLAVAVIAMMVRRDRLDFERMFMAALDPLRVQVAKVLLYLSRGPQPRPARLRVPVKISQEDIAAMIGTSRQSVNKELVPMVSEGIVVSHYGGIEVLDLERLAKVAAEDELLSRDFERMLFARAPEHYPGSD